MSKSEVGHFRNSYLIVEPLCLEQDAEVVVGHGIAVPCPQRLLHQLPRLWEVVRLSIAQELSREVHLGRQVVRAVSGTY